MWINPFACLPLPPLGSACFIISRFKNISLCIYGAVDGKKDMIKTWGKGAVIEKFFGQVLKAIASELCGVTGKMIPAYES
jgi:hypothetical protein